MKFTDKPIATAGLGIACALALLALLSWPGLASANPTYGTPSIPSSGNSGQGQPATIQSVATSSAIESSETSGSVPAANNSNLNGVGSSSASAGMVSSTAQTPDTLVASTITTVAMATTTAYNTTTAANALAQPVFALARPAGVSSGQNHSSSYITLIFLSISSVAIALGSMLFIKRRIDSAREIEPEIASG